VSDSPADERPAGVCDRHPCRPRLPRWTTGRRGNEPSAAVPEPADQAIGRSRGGLTTTLYALTDGSGRLLVVLLTGDNTQDSTMFASLLPAHLAAQAKDASGERLAVEPVQAYVDEATLPLVTGGEQNALLARTQLAAERSRLDATLLYVGTGPSPANRLMLAYAEADRQRRVNPRTGRLHGGTGRTRMAAADDGGTAA
jgi:hypothetical protein